MDQWFQLCKKPVLAAERINACRGTDGLQVLT